MDMAMFKIGITNCYLIGDKHQVLIDTGDPGKIEKFRKGFSSHSIDPADINLIVLTHTHWDHTGCLRELAEMSGARILVHRDEADRLRDGVAVLPPGISPWGRFLAKNLLGRMAVSNPEKIVPDVVMEAPEMPLSEYGIDACIIHTPGHSPGSISVIYEHEHIFVGDMAMSTFPLRLSPGMPIFAEKPELIQSSWDTILDRGVKTIYPSHGSPIQVDKLKRDLPKD